MSERKKRTFYTGEMKLYLLTHTVSDLDDFNERFGTDVARTAYNEARCKLKNRISQAMLLKELIENAGAKYDDKCNESKELAEKIRILNMTLSDSKSELVEYRRAYKRMQKELVEAQRYIRELEEGLQNKEATEGEDGFTPREIAYRRIVQKYRNKCEKCALRVQRKKIDNIWTD